LCSKHDIDMRMNEWNRHALFLSWNGRNRYLHSSLLRSGISSTRERNSVSFHSFRYAPLLISRNFSHSWKKSQIFNRDSCNKLLLCSPYWCPWQGGVYAFGFNWSDHNCWIVPPVRLICRAISQLALCRGHGILITPKWPTSAFWSLLWSSEDNNFQQLYEIISNM
jgi:hypothetical protein